MKKALSNLKKVVPPKARISILAAFFGIGVIAYFIISTITSSSSIDAPAQNGLVRVDTVIQPDTKITRNPMLSEDNSINRQVAELNKKDIDRRRNADSDLSHFEGINLNNRRNVNGTSEDSTNQNRDVVDLSSLFAETEEDRNERERRNNRRIEDLETKLDIPKKNSSNVLFDRASFLQQVDNEVRNTPSNNTNEAWSRSQEVAAFQIKDYSESANRQDTGRVAGDNLSGSSTINRSAVNQRREQYLSRYNDLKSDLEKRINGNTQFIEDSRQGQASEDNMFASEASQTDQNYPSNKTYGAGEIIYAINDIEIVSSETNVVRATVAQNGDVYNAILLGEFAQIGDVVGVRFSSYTVGGRSYTINAIAIDADSWKSGLADNVDRHYFSRYFGIIAAALLEGYSETLTNTTQTNTDSGTTQGQDRIENASERLQYSVGKVGEYLAPKMLDGLNRPSTVTVNRDKGIGVMFMADFRVPARR